MKLKYLWIDEYKNLTDFKLNFQENNGLTVIIGNNGSGKSNILEAISAIFYSIFNSKVAKFKYRLEYEKDGKIYAISAEKQKIANLLIDNKNLQLNKKNTVTNSQALPDKIVAIYSGEESRLYNENFEEEYLNFSKKLLKQYTELPQLKMQFINKEFWGVALLVLALQNLDDTNRFIKEDLSIEEILTVHFTFDTKMIPKNLYKPLNMFINHINPEKESEKEIQFSEIKQYFSDFSSSEVFTIFSQAALYDKVKTITSINATFSNSVELITLSEGEKKLILLFMILEVLSSENTIVLMDEPDAFIHEGRKSDLHKMLIKYPSIEKIITTHSPTLAIKSSKSSLKMISSNENGEKKIVDSEKIELIKQLTHNEWSVTDQNIVLESKKPLLLVEGKGDADYVRKAIEVLSVTDEDLNIDIDILPFGGASNAKFFIDNFKPCVDKNKLVVVLFDRDEAGCNGLFDIIRHGKDRADTETYKQNNWYYLKLPKTNDHTELDFLIEDYFSREYKKNIAQTIIDNAAGVFNCYPKDLKQTIKNDLSKNLNSYDSSILIGFSVLIHKLRNIIMDSETVTEI